MMYHIRSTVILLSLTMLLFSACRTAHSAAKEESETLSAETSQSSVSEDSSFASFFRSLSLRADSIVLWLQDSEAVQADTFSEEGIQATSADSSFCSSDSGFTAQSPKSPLPRARPSAKGRTLAKVLIGGVHLESQAAEEKVTSSHARDSLSARESRDSSLSESEESKPPNNMGSILFAILLIGGIAIFAFLGIKSVFKIK